MDFHIRPAHTTDLPELVLLCGEHAAYERSHFDPTGKEDALAGMLFHATARLKCLVVEGPANLIGYATFSVECSTWDAAYYMHMDCLFLRPEARNKGIGKALMKAIARQAVEEGVTRMQWQTPSFNVDAVRFYERWGPVMKEKYRLFLDEVAARTLANS